MRSAARTIGVAIFLLVALPAFGDDFVACWSDFVTDPISGAEEPVTRCRIAGGGVVDYGSDSSVP
ncbi:MAG TPA: hypothetical protein VIW94_00885, partial [Acidimicrobiia bacterium]